jgi:beta-xylosidase
LSFIEKNMLSKIAICTVLSFAALGVNCLKADSQTVQQGTQDASIQGDNNEINQTINQFNFNNPGKGAIKRKEPVTDLTNSQPNSTNSKVKPNSNNNNREGDRDRDVRGNSSKK